MPRTIIEHEPWCTDHNDEVNPPLCVSGFLEFGPPSVSEHAEHGERVGYLYLLQQGEDAAEVNIFFPTEPYGVDAMFGIGVLRKLVTALESDAEGTTAALRAALDMHDREEP